MSPIRLAEHYARAGYDVLAITDHWRRTDVETDALLVIPGAELHASLPGQRNAHVLGLGIDTDPGEFSRTRPDLRSTADWILERGGVPYLAHPYWSGVSVAELQAASSIVGVEVYNSLLQLINGRGFSHACWDSVLEAGRPCFALASDDSHWPGFDSGFASVWVRVMERSQAAVLDALRTGYFYSSTGPTITDIAVGDDSVEVTCSPSASVTLFAGDEKGGPTTMGGRVNAGRMGMVWQAEILSKTDDGGITAARIARPPAGPYGRIEVTDRYGRTAWTNPLWLTN